MTTDKPKRIVWSDEMKRAVAAEYARLLNYNVVNVDRTLSAETFMAAQATVVPPEKHRSLIDWHHINTWLGKLAREAKPPVVETKAAPLDKAALDKINLLAADLKETKRTVSTLSGSLDALKESVGKSADSTTLLAFKGLSGKVDDLLKRTDASVQRCGSDITHLEEALGKTNNRVGALSEIGQRQHQLVSEQALLNRRLKEMEEAQELHDIAAEIQEQESKAIKEMLQNLISKLEETTARAPFNLKEALDQARATAIALDSTGSNVVQFAQTGGKAKDTAPARHCVIVVGLYAAQLQELQVRYSETLDIIGVSNKKGVTYIKRLCQSHPAATVFLLRGRASADIEKSVTSTTKDYVLLATTESVSALYRHLDNLLEAKKAVKK